MIDPRYTTPDVTPSGVSYSYWVFRVPDVPEVRTVIRGELLKLSYPFMWNDDGRAMTAREAGWEIKEMLNGMSNLKWILGMPIPLWTAPVPSNIILANGQTVLRSDYPDLWEIVPVSMKTPTDITVPDLRDRFIMGDGSNLVNSIGGQDRVTLTLSQIPPHTHGYNYPSPNIETIGAGAPIPNAVGNPPFVQGTTSAGGGGSHDNIPPFWAMAWGIIGRLP